MLRTLNPKPGLLVRCKLKRGFSPDAYPSNQSTDAQTSSNLVSVTFVVSAFEGFTCLRVRRAMSLAVRRAS